MEIEREIELTSFVCVKCNNEFFEFAYEEELVECPHCECDLLSNEPIANKCITKSMILNSTNGYVSMMDVTN